MNETIFHGLDALRIATPAGSTALVTLQGAQVVSWIPAGGTEHLFVSERSAFVPGKPVRGGIPVVFPQFSSRGPLQKHGFARNERWTFLREDATQDSATLTLGLADSQATRDLWPHAFALEVTVAIDATSLEVRLLVRNTGEAPFAFTGALHTYLSVSDGSKASLYGMPGHPIPAADRIDRVIGDAPRETRLVDSPRTVIIKQRNFRDSVVWNPGREACASIADMTPEGFLHMLCVEAAAVETPIELVPGAHWNGSQTLVSRRSA